MARKIGELFWEIGANTSKFVKGLGDSKKQADQFKRGLGDTVKSVTGLNLASITAAGAVGALAVGMKYAVSQAAEAQKVQAQLNAVLQSTGGAAGLSAEEINRMAEQMSRLNAIDDEAIVSASSVMLTFTNIGKNVFPAAVQAAQDLSVAMGQDLQSSVVQIGKALNDPIAGITALQRVGVSFTSQQKDMIKTLVASGKEFEAQQMILEELSKEFGGSAAAAASTYEGKMKTLKIAVDNTAQAIGENLLPALTDLSTELELRLTVQKRLNDLQREHAEDIQKSIPVYEDYVNEQLRSNKVAFNALPVYTQIASAFILNIDALREFTNNMPILTIEEWNAVHVTDLYNGSLAQLAVMMGEVEEKNPALAEATANTTAQMDALSRVTQDIASSQNDMVSATKDLQQAQQDWKSNAGDDVVQSLEDAGIKGDKFYQALGVIDEEYSTGKQVQFDYTQDVKELVKEYRKTGDLEAFRDGLRDLKDTFMEQDEKVRALREHLTETEDVLKRLIAQQWNIKINIIQSGSIPATPASGGGETTVNLRAEGGPVTGGQPYIVGEHGPEMFVPSSSGTVVNNNDLRQMGGVTIVVNGTADPRAVAKLVAAEVQRARK